MELKKEFVKNCRKIGVLQEFLCQAIDQIDEKDTKIIQLEALIENYNRISKEIIDNANHQKRKRCLAMSEKYGIAAQMQHDFTMRNAKNAMQIILSLLKINQILEYKNETQNNTTT